MIVSHTEFARLVTETRAAAASPAEGLYGPSSTTWRIARDWVVFLGAGRAALLQLAHPYVAHAVAQHSETTRDPVGRFNRTFQALFGVLFGDLDTAVDTAWRVRSIHDRIHGPITEDAGRFPRGHRYHANEAEALFWVHATLVDTAVMAHEIGFGPLSGRDKEAYYRELLRTAALFGIDPAAAPRDWAAFSAYVARTLESDTITVGAPAREIASFLIRPANPVARPAMRLYAAFTAAMLPPRLREAFDLPYSPADAALVAASRRALRRAWPHIPERVRFRPEYHEAMARLRGRPRPDRLGRALEQMVLRLARPSVEHP